MTGSGKIRWPWYAKAMGSIAAVIVGLASLWFLAAGPIRYWILRNSVGASEEATEKRKAAFKAIYGGILNDAYDGPGSEWTLAYWLRAWIEWWEARAYADAASGGRPGIGP
jgi:hypothetical protein